MYFIIRPLMITLSMWTVGILIRKKIKHVVYIVCFLVFCLLDLMTGQKAYATNIHETQKQFIEIADNKYGVPNAKTEIKHLRIAFKHLLRTQSLTPENRQFYKDKVYFHENKGEECFNQAQEKCWYLPDSTDKEKSTLCFTTGMALLGPGKSKAKIAIAVLTMLGQYGLQCIDEWNEIQRLLHEADYHYEMMVFYQEVLDTYGGDD